MQNERELVRKIKAGDPRAFETLVSDYESKIYALALRFTGSPQDALDICQEVFLRIFRFVGNFNEDSKLSTWIYRIATNVCKDTLNRRARNQDIPLDREEDGEVFDLGLADSRYSPEEALLSAEIQDSIVSAILALPELYREIIILRDINGLTYDEIAAALELEVGTVKSRIARARERLRGMLSRDGNLLPSTRSNHLKGGERL